MSSRITAIVKTHLLDYLKKVYPDIVIKEKALFQCPFNCEKEPTAQLISNKLMCHNPTCASDVDVFDLVKKNLPSLEKAKDEDIADYLIHYLKLDIYDDTEELLKKYQQAGWALIPLSAGSKIPPKNFPWREKVYKNPVIWREWLDRGYGLALVLGKDSGVDAIDIDHKDTYEKVKHMLNPTLSQSTSRGDHYLYNYDEDIQKTLNKVLRDDGYDLEYRTDGAYIVIAPTSVDGEIRRWNNEKIADMGSDLKEFILSYYTKGVVEKTVDEEIQESITKNDLSGVKLNGLDGCCNDAFIRYGGILRKKCNIDQVKWALTHFNAMLNSPMDNKTMYSLMSQIEKYQHFDKEDMAKMILDHLEVVKTGSAFTLCKSLNLEQKDVEHALHYLEQEKRIICEGKNQYKKLEELEWVTGYHDMSVPLNVEIPYFSQYAYFDAGNMILIGGKTGTGKSHLCANIISKFFENKEIESIDLISTEAGSKIGKVLESLGVPHQFVCRPDTNGRAFHPTELELRDDRITLIDWIKPVGGDFSKMDNTFEHFHEQLKKHRGFLICFVQIRDDKDGTFFAKDQISNYSALSCKFLYQNGNNTNPYFQTTKIRDSKNGKQYQTIPLKYDFASKKLDLA